MSCAQIYFLQNKDKLQGIDILPSYYQCKNAFDEKVRRATIAVYAFHTNCEKTIR